MIYTPSYRAGLAQRLSLKWEDERESNSPPDSSCFPRPKSNRFAPLIREILQQTRCPLHITTTTETGQQMARRLFSSDVEIRYFPLDFSWTAEGALARPSAVVVLFETEFGPISSEGSFARIPLVIVNGRISETSVRFYRLAASNIRSIFSRLSGWECKHALMPNGQLHSARIRRR